MSLHHKWPKLLTVAITTQTSFYCRLIKKHDTRQAVGSFGNILPTNCREGWMYKWQASVLSKWLETPNMPFSSVGLTKKKICKSLLSAHLVPEQSRLLPRWISKSTGRALVLMWIFWNDWGSNASTCFAQSQLIHCHPTKLFKSRQTHSLNTPNGNLHTILRCSVIAALNNQSKTTNTHTSAPSLSRWWVANF